MNLSPIWVIMLDLYKQMQIKLDCQIESMLILSQNIDYKEVKTIQIIKIIYLLQRQVFNGILTNCEILEY